LSKYAALRITQEKEVENPVEVERLEKTRIIVAEPRKLFVDVLCLVLEKERDFSVVAAVTDGFEALCAAHECNPDILIIGDELPKLDGPQLIRELSRLGKNIRYLLLSEEADIDGLTDLYESGIHGCVLFSSGADELIRTVRQLSRGYPGFDARITGDLPEILFRARKEADQFADLTPREIEVVYWLGQGFSNTEIAQMMILSEKTVKNHVGHILRKLELRDRTQIAVLAWSTGLARKNPGEIKNK